MQRIIVTTMFIVLGITGPLLAQQTTGNINGRLVDAQGSAVPGVTVTAKNTQTGLTRTETSDAEGVYRLTALPVGVYDITAELQGFSKVDNKGIVVNVGQTIDVNMSLKVASLTETVTVTGESPMIETSSSSVGGVVESQAHREPPPERASVREPRGNDSGCGPRLPFRPDEEHAVRAANQRRRRAQRELPDRRRRQQRRHRRRPAPDVPARSDPGVQLRDAALQGGVRPEQRRRHEYRHEERDEQLRRELLRVVPRQGDERAHGDREDLERRQAGLPPEPVRRQLRRADCQGQGALLWRCRADAAGHDADGEHEGALPHS